MVEVRENLVPRPSSILILGLGNPILGDDGVGWRVAESLRMLLGTRGDVPEIDCAALGGLSLMERMLGYESVILIDSMTTGDAPQGGVRTFSLEELPNPGSGHTASPHDTSLATALSTAETLGAPIPKRVNVVAIETQATYDFSEKLSPGIEAAVPIAARHVLALLSQEDPKP